MGVLLVHLLVQFYLNKKQSDKTQLHENKNDPTRFNRSKEPLLATNKIFIVSSVRSCNISCLLQ